MADGADLIHFIFIKIMKKVMFVCKKNSARSQMAEGFAKTLEKARSKSPVLD